MEVNELEDRIEELEGELKILLLPKDPNDEKERNSGSQSWYGRRRSGFVRPGSAQNVYEICRKT